MEDILEAFYTAKAAGRVVCGIFRTKAGVAFAASWEREYPGCFISGQGGVVWSFRPVDDRLAVLADNLGN